MISDTKVCPSITSSRKRELHNLAVECRSSLSFLSHFHSVSFKWVEVGSLIVVAVDGQTDGRDRKNNCHDFFFLKRSVDFVPSHFLQDEAVFYCIISKNTHRT
jgi:hypothetical protein